MNKNPQPKENVTTKTTLLKTQTTKTINTKTPPSKVPPKTMVAQPKPVANKAPAAKAPLSKTAELKLKNKSSKSFFNKVFTTKRRRKIDIENQQLFLDQQFQDYATEAEFISFEKLINIALVRSSLSLSSGVYTSLENRIKMATAKKQEFIFSNFVISWSLNDRYSKTKLVPTIIKNESTSNEGVMLKGGKNEAEISLLKYYNDQLEFWIFNSKLKVEIIPNMIVYLSNNTNKLKIAFNEVVL